MRVIETLDSLQYIILAIDAGHRTVVVRWQLVVGLLQHLFEPGQHILAGAIANLFPDWVFHGQRGNFLPQVAKKRFYRVRFERLQLELIPHSLVQALATIGESLALFNNFLKVLRQLDGSSLPPSLVEICFGRFLILLLLSLFLMDNLTLKRNFRLPRLFFVLLPQRSNLQRFRNLVFALTQTLLILHLLYWHLLKVRQIRIQLNVRLLRIHLTILANALLPSGDRVRS